VDRFLQILFLRVQRLVPGRVERSGRLGETGWRYLKILCVPRILSFDRLNKVEHVKPLLPFLRVREDESVDRLFVPFPLDPEDGQRLTGIDAHDV
jgi:hypothetical protein